MDRKLVDYLTTYILKKGETLDLNNQIEGRFMEIPIIRSTKRTFRRLGMITIGSAETEPKEQDINLLLKELKLTPRKKLSLNQDDSQTIKWLEEGWILREVRLKPDGRTLASQHYRMGYRLYKYQQQIEDEQNRKQTAELEALKEQLLQLRLPQDQPSIKAKILQQLKVKYELVCDITELKTSEFFPQNWSFQKRLKFLHFTLAFVERGLSRNQFDWKEIGASYYQAIGGSKIFDRNQQEFLELLEDWSGYPAFEYGLTSLGHITPVFFAGEVKGIYSSYTYGPIHAATNLSIEKEQYETTATTLWIVENRGILTRIASEPDFLKEETTMIVCCDGHIRSAHRNFFIQLAQHKTFRQAIIWTDYDVDGTVIADDLYKILNNHIPVMKWVGPEGNLFYHREEYIQEMNQFLQSNQMEQEERTGDVTQWRRWINA